MNVFLVDISPVPGCNCGFVSDKEICEHVIYIVTQVLGVKESDQNLCQKVHSKAYIKDLLSGYKASSSKTVEPTNRQTNVGHAINDIVAPSTPAQPQSNQSIRQVSNCSGQHSSSSSTLTGPLVHVTHASVFQGIAEAPQAHVSRILPAQGAIFTAQHTPRPPLPHDLVIVTKMRRVYFEDGQERVGKLGNVYFHCRADCVKRKQPLFWENL